MTKKLTKIDKTQAKIYKLQDELKLLKDEEREKITSELRKVRNNMEYIILIGEDTKGLTKPNYHCLDYSLGRHLHPKEQSQLAIDLVNKKDFAEGIKTVVIKTYSQDFVNQIRFQVYKGNILPEKVSIIYQEPDSGEATDILIDHRGHFINSSSQERERFPSGFFDATLKELLTIG